jgi:hypothetical protein
MLHRNGNAGCCNSRSKSMPTQTKRDLPLRAGVYSRVPDVERTVEKLKSAGFSNEEIVVVCSDKAKERHFRQFAQQQPAGQNAPTAAVAGSTLGAALGGVSMLALGVATGGLPLAIVGGAGLLTGGVVGGFLSAMLMRGVEKEAADYYDQAVEQGKLLIAVECSSEDVGRLALAERILAESGAEPLPLPEG